jgi:hypothetical protein
VEVERHVGEATYFQYLVMDHRGTAYRVTDESGATQIVYTLDAFGRELSAPAGADPNVPNELIYQSNWLTTAVETKPVGFTPSRLYSPGTGGFVQRDPLAASHLRTPPDGKGGLGHWEGTNFAGFVGRHGHGVHEGVVLCTIGTSAESALEQKGYGSRRTVLSLDRDGSRWLVKMPRTDPRFLGLYAKGLSRGMDLNLYHMPSGSPTCTTDPLADPGEELAQVRAAAHAAGLNEAGREALKAAIEETKAGAGMSPKQRLPWKQLFEMAKTIARENPGKYTRGALVVALALVYVEAGAAAAEACERIACLQMCRMALANDSIRKGVVTIVSIDPPCYCYRVRLGLPEGELWYSEDAGDSWHPTGMAEPTGP